MDDVIHSKADRLVVPRQRWGMPYQEVNPRREQHDDRRPPPRRYLRRPAGPNEPRNIFVVPRPAGWLRVVLPRPDRAKGQTTLPLWGSGMNRIGGSTYSRQPFRPQFEDLHEAGFDYAELDLSWLRIDPNDLRREAFGLAEILPVETAHLPPPRFSKDHLNEIRGFLQAIVAVGCRTFNVHLVESRFVSGVPLDRKVPWLADLVDAARAAGATVTLENLDEDIATLRAVFDAIPHLQFCLDIGHASLDGITDRPVRMLEAFAPRLGLVHAHDNRGGHGEAGDLHLPFGRGGIPLESILRAVRRSGFGGPATLELFSGTREEKTESLRKARAWLGP